MSKQPGTRQYEPFHLHAKERPPDAPEVLASAAGAQMLRAGVASKTAPPRAGGWTKHDRTTKNQANQAL